MFLRGRLHLRHTELERSDRSRFFSIVRPGIHCRSRTAPVCENRMAIRSDSDAGFSVESCLSEKSEAGESTQKAQNEFQKAQKLVFLCLFVIFLVPLLVRSALSAFGFDKLRRVNTADSRYIYTCRR